ncbi:MAG: Unknown protein [uncultured Sulfurovum sp.]|uniref:Cytochrome c domain-containing protein n=1 Tax=uncultured Sulfurovum sp. TaxID=269237 RepID=A0A6S6T398_9BACT|nr:MAG: Unknown protein [uncultured Sulfurovum sp.]
MKNIIMVLLLAGSSLVAAESVDTNKTNSSSLAGVDGKKFYEKRCSVCHGEKGEKTPLRGMKPLAGMDAGKLARKIKAYRDQDQRHGAYAIFEDNVVMSEATYSISDQQISAIATYLSGLK